MKKEFGEPIDDPAGQRVMRQRYETKEQELRKGRTQHYSTRCGKPRSRGKVPKNSSRRRAGTVSIVHFDIVHGGFLRKHQWTASPHGEVPVYPQRRTPRTPAGTTLELLGEIEPKTPEAPAWEYVWNWHKGTPRGVRRYCPHRFPNNVRSDDDRLALGAAYTLGAQPGKGVGDSHALFFGDDVGLVPWPPTAYHEPAPPRCQAFWANSVRPMRHSPFASLMS
ncbi:MAG: hypothetical protein Ct9H300mP8_02870 [Gammaproteobacteria bacterium]|nr:MAG: hypothetical protein Ct9H300mP8_02870 [Gammaproteobacteria bacterium]